MKYGIDEKILNIIIESIQKSGIKNDEFNNYINVLIISSNRFSSNYILKVKLKKCFYNSLT